MGVLSPGGAFEVRVGDETMSYRGTDGRSLFQATAVYLKLPGHRTPIRFYYTTVAATRSTANSLPSDFGLGLNEWGVVASREAAAGTLALARFTA